MKKSFIAFAFLVSLTVPSAAEEAAKATPTFIQLRKAVIALDCSEYADSPKTFKERDRLRKIGLETASILIDKYRDGVLSKEDAGLVAYTLRIEGLLGGVAVAGHDNKEFILGRLFQGEVDFVRNQLAGEPNFLTAGEVLYKKNNCDLIE